MIIFYTFFVFYLKDCQFFFQFTDKSLCVMNIQVEGVMMNWTVIKDLHVIKKLDQMIGKWFSLDGLFFSEFGKVQHDLKHKNYKFHDLFFKVFTQTGAGYDIFLGDFEKIKSKEFDKNGAKIIDSDLPHLSFMVHKLEDGKDFLGHFITSYFSKKPLTEKESGEIKDYLIELGAKENDAEIATENLRVMGDQDKEYLGELIGVVADEVVTYHQEIVAREERIKDLNSEVSSQYRYHSMIGKSEKMRKIYRLLEKVSNSESTILIQGENGTGKEVIAKAIHYNSPRKDNIFLAVNCSALNDNLLDSELFGHVKGAFTGAVKDKKGLFETANGGTIFLDEIGDTSLTMQVKLLRVLQEGTFLPVGGTSPKKVNVRVLAATNKPLKEMIEKGEFREDFYYRVNVINIHLPALRERKDDIPLLVEHFLEKRCAETGMNLKQLSKKTLEKLLDYNWPGNVRELQNEIERLVILSGDDQMINPEYLSGRIFDYGNTPSKFGGINMAGSLREALEELEMMIISEGLKRCDYNKSRLARELGISRAGLIMKVDKYDLDKRKKKAS